MQTSTTITWSKVPLKELIKLNYGKALPTGSRKEGNIPVYGSNGVIGKHNKALVNSPTIVIGRKGSVGKAALSLAPSWVIDTAFYVEIVNSRLDLKYLYLFCSLISDRLIFPKGVKPGINREEYLRNEIPLPFKDNQINADEQEVIVSRVENLFTDIEMGISKTDKSISNAEKIIYGEFNKIFGGKLPRNWKSFELGDVVKVTMGQSPPSSTYNQNGEGLPFFQGKADFTEKYPQPRVYCTQPLRTVEKDDVLVSVRAPVGAVNLAQDKSCIGRGLAGLNSKKVNHLYLFNFLQYLEPQWETKSRGSTFKSINRDDIKLLDISLPIKNDEVDLIEQEKISRRLEDLRILVSKLANEYRKQSDYFNLLKQSGLNYALAGKFAVSTQSVAQKARVNIFPIQQAIGVIVQSFERGEMVIAKLLYMAQEIHKAPLGIQFTPQNFGPYDAVVKRAITSGLSHRNQFFSKKQVGGQEVFAPGTNINNLMKYNYRSTQQVRNFLNQMMPTFKSADSGAIERLATVCKIVQDNKTVDEAAVKAKLQEWKPNKFKDADVTRTLNFIKTKGWDKILTQ